MTDNAVAWHTTCSIYDMERIYNYEEVCMYRRYIMILAVAMLAFWLAGCEHGINAPKEEFKTPIDTGGGAVEPSQIKPETKILALKKITINSKITDPNTGEETKRAEVITFGYENEFLTMVIKDSGTGPFAGPEPLREYYKYNSDGELEEITQMVGGNDGTSEFFDSSYKYNNDGRLIAVERTLKHAPLDKYTYKYKGNTMSSSWYGWDKDTNSWVLSNMQSENKQTYNDAGLPTLQESSLPAPASGGAYKSMLKWEYTDIGGLARFTDEFTPPAENKDLKPVKKDLVVNYGSDNLAQYLKFDTDDPNESKYGRPEKTCYVVQATERGKNGELIKETVTFDKASCSDWQAAKTGEVVSERTFEYEEVAKEPIMPPLSLIARIPDHTLLYVEQAFKLFVTLPVGDDVAAAQQETNLPVGGEPLAVKLEAKKLDPLIFDSKLPGPLPEELVNPALFEVMRVLSIPFSNVADPIMLYMPAPAVKLPAAEMPAAPAAGVQ
jgi:hypothetical protein